MSLFLQKREWGIWFMIKEYCRYRKAIILFYVCVMLFFPLIHFLYNYPMESMIYSVIIFTFLFIIWMTVDGYFFYNRIKKLNTIIHYMSRAAHEFPESKNLVDEKYIELIQGLYQVVNEKINIIEDNHAEQIEYFTMWVHQIKTPISAMRLAIQSKEYSTDKYLIEHELFKIEQYVEMALQYVKIKRLSSDLMIQEYSLTDIINQSVKKYASFFIYKKLSLEISDVDHRILTDSKWLSFIVEQILSNAIKYTSNGGIKVYMKEKTLCIQDTGMGIRKEDINRIFEKGYTGYNGRLDKKASGIGLYLVKKVSDALAIRIMIDSRVGVGTKVELTFPEKDCHIYE